MKKRSVFDDASRILASSISRRQAFKYLGALVGGSALAVLGGKPVQAQAPFCADFSVIGTRIDCDSHVGCNGKPPGAKCGVDNAGRALVCVSLGSIGNVHCCGCQ
jgi:hypothetical protein